MTPQIICKQFKQAYTMWRWENTDLHCHILSTTTQYINLKYFSLKSLIYICQNQSKTPIDSFIHPLRTVINPYFVIFQLAWPNSTDPQLWPDPIKTDCKWPLPLFRQRALLMLIHDTPPLPVSLSLPPLSSQKRKGGKSLGIKWGGESS